MPLSMHCGRAMEGKSKSLSRSTMFPTQKLFGTLPCPQLATCQLTPCLYSHAVVPRLATPTSSSSSSSTAQKRLPTIPARALLPRKTLKTNEGNAVASGSHLPPPKPKRPVAVPQAPIPAVRSPSSYSYAHSRQTGPPKLDSSGNTHSPFLVRRQMLSTLYNQYLLIYASLPNQSRAKSLASMHALAEELDQYKRSNKVIYRNAIISALVQLKRRPQPTSEDETGTIVQYAERVKQLAEKEKGKLTREKVAKFIASRETLLVYDYVIEVPGDVGGSRPDEEGKVAKCDRCGTEWLVKGELDDVSPALLF